MAAGRPNPGSPPVVSALRPVQRPPTFYDFSAWSGRGSIFPASPGQGCDCPLKGGLGYFDFGSSSCGAAALSDFEWCSAEKKPGDVARPARPAPSPVITRRRVIPGCSFVVM